MSLSSAKVCEQLPQADYTDTVLVMKEKRAVSSVEDSANSNAMPQERQAQAASAGVFIIRSGVKKIVGLPPDFLGIEHRPLTREEIVEINRTQTLDFIG